MAACSCMRPDRNCAACRAGIPSDGRNESDRVLAEVLAEVERLLHGRGEWYEDHRAIRSDFEAVVGKW